MEQLVLIFECVWICVHVCVCPWAPWSSSQWKVLNHVLLICIPCMQCSLYDWARKGAEIFFWMCCSPTGLYLCFIILVIHSSFALFKTLYTTSGIFYIRKPAVTKCISAVLWILFCLSCCSLQRKWMRRLECVIMRKPLQLFTLSKFTFTEWPPCALPTYKFCILNMFHWKESMN